MSSPKFVFSATNPASRSSSFIIYMFTSWRPVCAVALSVALVMFIALTSGAWTDVWRLVSVPAMSMSFADLRLITYGAICGDDPYVATTCDPWGRTFNYPSAWLLGAGALGIGPESTDVVGVIFASLLMLAFAIAFRPTRTLDGLVTILAVASPPVLLAIERGNSDVIIFAALVFVLAATRRLRPLPRSAGLMAAIAVLTMLKVFPIAALAIFARNRRGLLTALAAGAIALVGLGLTAGSQLGYFATNTPIAVPASFGSIVLPTFVLQLMEIEPPWSSGNARWVGLLVSAGIAAAVCLVLAISENIRKLVPSIRGQDWRTDLTIAGLSIYVFAFTLGASYDYRLIALVLALPGLALENLSQRSQSIGAFIGMIVVFLWVSRASSIGIDELLDLIIYGSTVAVLVRNTLWRKASSPV